MAILTSDKIKSILDIMNDGIDKTGIIKIRQLIGNIISSERILEVKQQLKPLKGIQLEILRLPRNILIGFEPSQIGTIVGTIMDAAIPQLAEILPDNDKLEKIGLLKHEGILGDREGYPDYKLTSGERLELKLLYVDPEGVEMKKPPTPREPSARLTQKVTFKNVDPKNDLLLVITYQLQPLRSAPTVYSPTIIDFDLFPVIECIIARDSRLSEASGRWFGNFETPTIPSRIGQEKIKRRAKLSLKTYGRKESEGKDFNEDTNFGKLKRIPYPPLQRFLKKCGANYSGNAED